MVCWIRQRNRLFEILDETTKQDLLDKEFFEFLQEEWHAQGKNEQDLVKISKTELEKWIKKMREKKKKKKVLVAKA
ncbi:MAG: hypothetical protein ACE5K4_09290 [Candidatus Hydrothermarchaeota archaeon]